jgi:hypothetical protein
MNSHRWVRPFADHESLPANGTDHDFELVHRVEGVRCENEVNAMF